MELDDFLKPPSSGGGPKKFLKNWKDNGSIVVFLHQQLSAPKTHVAWPVWSHPFNYRGTIKDKESGKEIEVLRFKRFVSPDAPAVHQNQFFRNRPQDEGPLGRLQVPPVLDPFLLLREWLYHEIEDGKMSPDEIIFEWTNPRKNNELTQWRAGHLSRHEKRAAKGTWNHSLDTKLEYFFVVVDAENPQLGAQIERVPKLLSDKMAEEITSQRESEGADEGNPFLHPYAFKWKYDKNANSPMNYYSARRFNSQELTDEILEAIRSDEFPDPSPMTRPRDGDKALIRAAFQDAAKIDLPWDQLFVPEWKNGDDDADEFADDDSSSYEVKNDDTSPPDRETAAATGTKTRKRRKKKKSEKPAWDVSPEERFSCEDCGSHMHPGWEKCPGCGAVYDLEGETPVPMPAVDVLKAAGWVIIGGAQTSAQSDESATGDEEHSCFACGAAVTDPKGKCPSCGIDLGDDLPFG